MVCFTPARALFRAKFDGKFVVLWQRFIDKDMASQCRNNFPFDQDLDRFDFFQLSKGINNGVYQDAFGFRSVICRGNFRRKIDISDTLFHPYSQQAGSSGIILCSVSFCGPFNSSCNRSSASGCRANFLVSVPSLNRVSVISMKYSTASSSAAAAEKS